MASSARAAPSLLDRLLPNRLLAAASLVLALAAIVAVLRGAAEWSRVPALIWLHLAAVLTATLLTPVMLLRRKGTRRHRQLGWVWSAAMLAAAAIALFFNAGHPNGYGVFSGDVSPIHGLSVLVLVAVPLLIARARQHRVTDHERGVRGLVFGALLIAGWFTFPFDRLLGRWLFG
ncbi:hypothetical protein IP88_04370 [alpha proteobacterium AAP81b]|nr:hypothetical protein IP88_04370 [alpha proteobacterium AAP81b]